MKTLNELLSLVRDMKMTPDQEAEQRRSFAFGNCNIENPDVTRQMVDDADQRLFPRTVKANG